MKPYHAAVLAAFVAVSLQPCNSRAANEMPSIEDLLKRIDELERKVKILEAQRGTDAVNQLEQKVKVLERDREFDKAASAEAARTTPVITAGASGFTVRSADTNFVVTLRGQLQVDTRTYLDDGGIRGNDGFLLRRARPILQGTLYRDFDFAFVPDFGGSTVQIFDAYLNYRFAPWLQLRAGKFKSPLGLEMLVSDPNTLFNERSIVTGLVPTRDLGFELFGHIGGETLSYYFGIFNGAGDGRVAGNFDFEDHREFAGRLFAHPFKKSETAALRGVGLGIAGSYGDIAMNAGGLPTTFGGTLPGYLTDGLQQFFAYNPAAAGAVVVADGAHWRLSPQGYYYYGPFGMMGEYVISNQRVTRTGAAPLASARLGHTGWEIAASWLLTGEDATYNIVVPKHAFDPASGHWGAFQVVARYAELDIDDATFPLFADPASSASSAHAWSIGLNWYLNRNIRVATSFSRTMFSGGGTGATAPGAVTRQPENVFFSRLQLAF